MRTSAHWALRLVLGALLAYAGVEKLTDASAFAEQVANYQWWPQSALLVAVFLPPLELVSAACLCAAPRPWCQAAALLACGMFAVFTVAVARAYWIGINIDCGCFGEGSGEIGPVTITRNVALTAAAGALVWLSRAAPARDAS